MTDPIRHAADFQAAVESLWPVNHGIDIQIERDRAGLRQLVLYVGPKM